MRKLYIIHLLFFWFFTLGMGLDLFSDSDSDTRHMPLFVNHRILEESKWFDTVKPYCNSIEYEFAFKLSPPPKDDISQAYAAACYTLAGEKRKAEEKINSFPPKKRPWASGLVYRVTEHVTDMKKKESDTP